MTEHIFSNTSNKSYEYLLVRYEPKGLGITGEFEYLDINNKRVINYLEEDSSKIWGNTEAELFQKLGKAGWRLVNHSLEDTGTGMGIYTQRAKFIREIN